jgi:hypothetical protein
MSYAYSVIAAQLNGCQGQCMPQQQGESSTFGLQQQSVTVHLLHTCLLET